MQPASDLAAIAQLESLRYRPGPASYLAIPQAQFGWVEQYPKFARHLERRYVVAHRSELAIVYRLAHSPGDASWQSQLDDLIGVFASRYGHDPAILDCNSGLDLKTHFPEVTSFSPPNPTLGMLPYLDRTVDLVIIQAADRLAMAEARRVAVGAVAQVSNGSLEIDWLANGTTALPSVSIVIPSYNGIAFTEQCVRSLMETVPSWLDCEFVVVDDCSTDDTQERLAALAKRDRRLRVLRNEVNSGFLMTCNRGAFESRGEIVLWLNNDTIALPGWLPPLLRIFREDPDVGGVGGKLIFPDGRLQEAGGVVFRDGRSANLGKWHPDPADPLFDYVREVDYVSGAHLAFRRTFLEKVGGFDERYRPIYCEDSDICFKARELGLKVVYQPESAIVHIEGATSGKDESKGDKRYQLLNRDKFNTRWADALIHQPVYPNRFDLGTLHRLAVRGVLARRALVVAPLPPEYDRESGSQSILDIIQSLVDGGWAVSFVAENPRPKGGERYMRMLRQLGVAAYGGFGSRTDELLAEGRFDLVICAFWYIAEAILPRVRALSPQTRVMVNSMDLHFLRNARRIFAGGERLDLDYAGEFVRELNTYGASDGVLTVSGKEAELLGSLLGDASMTFVNPDTEEPRQSALGFDERSGIVFIGNFRHPPNVEAVKWLLDAIVPLLPPTILEDHPVYIVGNDLPDAIAQRAQEIPGVRMVGWVPSVVPYLHQARVSVVPLLHGAGTKRKAIQALAVGTPIVSTSIGVEGLVLRDGKHALVADERHRFAGAVSRLLGDRKLWTTLAASGRVAVARSFSRVEARRQFHSAVETVLGRDIRKARFGDAERELIDRLVKPRYRQLVERIRRVAEDAIPPGARVAVVSRGDADLLTLGALDAEHFPGDDNGAWLGWYPENGEQATALLERAVERKVQYLLVPQTAAWWLSKYPELAARLERDWQEVVRDEETCVVYQRREDQP